MLIFASFWDRFWKQFWIVFGSTFGALGGQKGAKCHQDSMRKLASKKVGSEEAQLEVNLPPGGRRFARKEVKKKARKEEGKLGGKGGI